MKEEKKLDKKREPHKELGLDMERNKGSKQIQVLRQAAKKQAFWLMRHYREAADYQRILAEKRPSLIASLFPEDISENPVFSAYDTSIYTKSDRDYLEKYARCWQMTDAVAVILTERMRKRDADIVRRIMSEGASVRSVAEESDLPEILIKRIRTRFKKAYADEMQSRFSRWGIDFIRITFPELDLNLFENSFVRSSVKGIPGK